MSIPRETMIYVAPLLGADFGFLQGLTIEHTSSVRTRSLPDDPLRLERSGR
jgi:hypothetical protein